MGKLNTVQNGKTSKPKPVNLKKFEDNYSKIKWKSKT